MGNCCEKLFKSNKNNNSTLNNTITNPINEPLNRTEIDQIFQKSATHREKSMTCNNITTQIKDGNIILKDISKKDFKIIKVIGRGSFGKVLLVKYLKDDRMYAMKILKKAEIKNTKQIIHTKTEREILARVDHDLIVKLKFAFQTVEKLYLVTDFMQGGELFYHLHLEGRFNENKTRFYVCEIILALEYLHNCQIIYRDLKPENILLDAYGHVKLADFGLSKFILSNDNNKAFTVCGPPEYLAPEILSGLGYDQTVDWWSLGILIFEMLCGSSPFKYDRQSKLEISLYEKKVEIPFYFSESSSSLVHSLLQIEPSNRLGYGKNDAKDIKNHEFFNGINWNDVAKKNIPTPFRPVLKSSDDLVYFDKIFTEEKAEDTPGTSVFPSRSKYDDTTNKYDMFTYKCNDDNNKTVNTEKSM